MTEQLINKKEVLQCRDKSCRRTFNQSELVKTEQSGIKRRGTCPHCGSSTYGLMDYPVDEEILIYGDSHKNLRVSKKDSEYALMNKYRLYDEQELEFFMNGYIVR